MVQILQVGDHAKRMSSQRGVSYVVLLVFIAIASISTTITNRYASHIVQRELEEEWLFRGLQYQNAIKRYYEAQIPSSYPNSLANLLRDPRFAHQQYLRKLYPDPFTLEKEIELSKDGAGWGLIKNPRGEIIGVASQSTRTLIKREGFPKSVKIEGEGSQLNHVIFVFIPEPTLTNPGLNSTNYSAPNDYPY